MKIPKARQLPSGAWFCRVRIDGQDIPITRPTEKEAVAEAMAIKAGLKHASRQPGRDKTLTQAIDAYIADRQNVLSPATIRGYRTIQRNMFQPVMHARLAAIPESRWQQLVNTEARSYSGKTVKNAWGFIASVLRSTTGQEPMVRVPQVVPKERPFLDADQIHTFLGVIRGTKAEIPALLALSSLRRSEIVALRWEDVDLKKGLLRVNGAAVPDENHKFVRKAENKNSTSHRIVPLIPPLQSALEAARRPFGPVVTVSAYRIYVWINEACDRAELPRVGVHGLRHSFASLAVHLQIPEQIAMEIGGWADPGTMRKIYTHISRQDRSHYGTAFTDFFQSDNKNGNEK